MKRLFSGGLALALLSVGCSGTAETPTPGETDTPSPTATGTPTASATPTPTATASATPTPTPTASETPTPTATPTPSDTPTATPSDTPTATPSGTPTPTPSGTPTPTPSGTPTPTPSGTPTATPSGTPTPTPSGTPTPTATATATPTATLADGPRIRAEDQTALGPNELVIAEVFAEEAGFVAVFDQIPGEDLIIAVGSQAVPAGLSTDVSITLDRVLAGEELLYAILHSDTGEQGLFEFPDFDPAVTDGDGELVIDSFTVTREADSEDPVIQVQDQIVDPPDQVLIDLVIPAVGETGFVAIYLAGEDDDPEGDPLGVSEWINIGTTNIEITTDEPLDDGSRLVAQLHVDDGDETFDASVDVPALTGAGDPVRAAFVVTLRSGGDGFYDLVVDNQPIVGATEINITQLDCEEACYLVIYEDDQGDLGQNIGMERFPAGTYSDAFVYTDRDLQDGEQLFAVLHIDLGTPGTFEEGTDPIATGPGGDEVKVPFAMEEGDGGPGGEGGSIEARDQTLDLATVVTIAAVEVPGPGWVAVFDDEDGLRGQVLGYTQVDGQQGRQTDIEVVLNRPLGDGEVIYAAALEDFGEEGVFEFPDTDVIIETGPDTFLETLLTVTVPESAPAVRLYVNGPSPSEYLWTQVEPEAFSGMVSQESNGDLTFSRGWRYEIINATPSGHPLEFYTQNDLLLLSQGAEGVMEGEESLNWIEDGGTIRFTAAAAFAENAAYYVCQYHSGMKGDITTEAAP